VLAKLMILWARRWIARSKTNYYGDTGYAFWSLFMLFACLILLPPLLAWLTVI